MKRMLTIILLMATICSCKTYAPINGSHSRDSVRVVRQVDSVVHIIRDSVTMQMPCNDSIEVAYVDRWRTITKTDVHTLYDTTYICSTDTIYKPYPVTEVVVRNSGFARFCIWHTIIVWILILMTILVTVAINLRR